MTEGHPSWPSIINFILLLGALTYLLRKPLGKALFGRQEKVAKAVEESEALRQEVEKMVCDYEGKLAQLDTEIAKLITDAKEEGEREREEILVRAKETAGRIVEDARVAGIRETERMKQKLQHEVVGKAILQASKLLKGKVTEKEHLLFTDELVNSLEEYHGTRG